MDKVFQILQELVPIGVAALIAVSVYFFKVFKDLSDKVTKVAQQQAEYMKERVESVDKTTAIFERTVQHQEKELKRLYQLNQEMKRKLETKKDKNVAFFHGQLETLIKSIETKAGRALKGELEKLSLKASMVRDDTAKAYDEIIQHLSKEQDLIASLWTLNTPEAEEEIALLETMQRSSKGLKTKPDES